jgi:serine/threonine protein kinase/acid stress-induced BolA-like protein IbaG/YrbA
VKVEASNSAGSAERVLKITVHAADVPFGLSYPAHRPDGVFYPGHQYEIGEPVRIEPDSLPRCTNTVRYIMAPFRYIIRPQLPAGLDMDSATGVIHGDATEDLETTRFVVTALHMGAQCCAIIRIKVAAACGPHEKPEWEIPTDLASSRGATITAGRRYETNERLLKTQLRNKLYCQRICKVFFRAEPAKGTVCAKFSSEPSLPKGLAIDENGQILGIPLELSTNKRVYTITAEHRNFRRSVDIVFEIREPQEGLAILALGLEWSELGSERPTTGTEIRNETLSQALQSKLKWTQVDFGGDSEKFNAFMVPNLTRNDFIKVGDTYYAPADACIYSEPIHVPRPERSPASIENMEQPGGGSVRTDSLSKASTEAQRSQPSRASAGQASRPDGESVPVIKEFVFEKKLGAGGQGTVWLATHQGIQRAIKICQNMDDSMQNREVQNLNALTVLQHPNVVRFIDYLDEHHALVMEYIDGRSLKTHLHESRGKLKWEEACIIMRGILSGLECLHCSTPEFPMLHRDVTPANVMLRESPVQHTVQVVLIDLGLSKRIQEKGQTITVGEKFIGTPEYLSPEIVRGLDPKAFDTRVDVWAAGVILYEMLAGKRPFTGVNYLQIFECIKNKSPKSISTAGSGVNKFIYRALEKEREKRFTDASDMLNVFNEVCKNRQNIPEQLMQPQKPSQLDQPKGRPRIAAFFAKKCADVPGMLEQVRVWAQDESIEKAKLSKEVAALIERGVESLDLYREAEKLMLGFEHSRSLFEVDVHAQPTYQNFLGCMLGARERNVRVLHLAGHGTARCGFVWVTKHPATDYHEVSMEEFAKLFETEAAGGGGTVECVVLNACESEEMAKRLRKYGVPHVVCWRSEVRDVTAMRFSETFYKALDCQGDNSRDYKRAFEQAAQPARMRSSESPGAQRKTAKYAVRGAVDFICLLSKDGDVFPEPPKEAPSSTEAKEIGDVSADAGPKKLECESSTLSLDCVSRENALDDEEVIGESCR